MSLHRHCSRTHARPAWPIRLARLGSASGAVTALTTAVRSRPSTTLPVTPLRTVSGAPPELPAMTGSPVAEASR